MKNSKLITAALLGLLSASAMASQTVPTGSPLPAEEKEGCKGKDGCKGEKEEEKSQLLFISVRAADMDACPMRNPLFYSWFASRWIGAFF